MGDGQGFRRKRRRLGGGMLSRGMLSRDRAKRGGASTSSPLQRRMRLEPLEDRRMLATFLVTNLMDLNAGGNVVPGSLRAAVNAANNNNNNDNTVDIILFSDVLTGTIALQGGANGGQLNITESVRIIGPGPQKIGITAAPNTRIFNTNIESDEDTFLVEISGLTLSGGNMVTGPVEDRLGGAIYNREDLRMTEVVIQNNSAQRGGGGIYHLFGSLTINRSLIISNSGGGLGGGGILVGSDEDDDGDDVPRPSATIANTTVSLNTTGGNGGGVYNRGGGTVNIIQSTIINNLASLGAGVASFGNPIAEEEGEDPPAPFRFTNIYSSIIAANLATGMDDVRMTEGGDLDEVGASDGDGEGGPMPLEPSIFSDGFNVIGTTNVAELADTDQVGVADPMLDQDDFGLPIDRGGSTPVYLPLEGSPALDMGGLFSRVGGFDQRGRHFSRIFGAAMDVGAAELQEGLFIVDLIVDETDFQYSEIAAAPPVDPYLFGDFSLREALEFSSKNPLVDTILFSPALRNAVDPTISPAPTILLTLGALTVDQPVFILGPTTWLLEIDASGNDPTPLLNNSDGSRVFEINNGFTDILIDVTISDLTLMGADAVGSGGALFSHENLFAQRLTLKDNNVSNDGGAVYIRYGNLTIEDSTINGNRAANNGAGVYIASLQNMGVGDVTTPVVSITNSTISGNVAGNRGAGIANNGGQLLVEYSTITLNSSGSLRASGIVNLATAGLFTPSTEIRSTILSGNANNDIEFFNGATLGTFVSLGYNLVGNGNAVLAFNAAGDRTGILDPLLEPLAITGGLLATHRPRLGSPVIDMGDPDAMPAEDGVPEFDQRGPGFSRVFDGNSDGTARIDIGSYELQPSMIVVDSPGDIDDGDLSQGNVSLREAIKLSNLNPVADVIVFDITRLPSVISINTTSLLVTDTVKIIGPGSGVLAISSAVPLSRMMVIDDATAALRDIEISGLEFRNALEGVILSRENLALSDITFINNSATTPGGAVYHENGAFSLRDSLITGNFTSAANAHGGALYLKNASGEIYYSTIAGNSVKQTASNGGAVALVNSDFIITLSTITGNSTNAGAAMGGGVSVSGGQLLVEETAIAANSTFGANSAGGGLAVANGAVVTLEKSSILSINNTFSSQSPGGGAFVTGATLNIVNSLVAQNGTSAANSPGGGVANLGGTVNISGTNVFQNTTAGSNSDGGGISNRNGNLVVRDSAIVGNSANHAAARAGGVYSDGNLTGTQTATILNSTISGNSASSRGGGVFNADGRMDIKHSTITNNSTLFMNAGNGVASAGNANTLTTVQSSIIAGNVGVTATPNPTGSDVDFIDVPFANSFQSLGYNVIGTGNAVSAFTQTRDKILIANPLLGPLATNGGPTQTHALLEGSPAVNNGDAAFNPNAFTPALTTDQRGVGFPRVLGGRIDSGAFESAFTGPTSDFNLNGVADGADFLIWQRGVGINSGATKAQGDANGDGRVNAADLAIWRGEFGAGGSIAAAGEAAIQAVMAPASSSWDASSSAASIGYEPVILSESSAPTDVGFVAGAGVPAAAARPSYRPPAARRAAEFDAVDAAYAHVFAPVSLAATDGAEFGLASDGDAESADDLSSEDAVFALLGEGLL